MVISERSSLASLPLTPLQWRWLAEAVRLNEDRAGAVQEHAEAEAAGRAAGGDLEQRVMARAQALPQAAPIAHTILAHMRIGRVAVVVAMLLALLSGLLAARLTLGAGPTVNIVYAFVALLGTQWLMLLLWLILLAMPGARDALLGRAVAALVRVVHGRWGARALPADDFASPQPLHSPRRRIAAGLRWVPVTATAGQGLLARTGIGRWLFGAIAHGFWFCYTAGALLGCLLWLAIQQYDFYWATTILPDAWMERLLGAVAHVPGWFGFSVPDAELIRGSRLGTGDGTGRDQWSALLLGSLLFFGLLPRGLLAALCAWLAFRAARRTRLDLTQPGYARLAPRLQPVAAPMGRLGPDEDPPARVARAKTPPATHKDGLIAMVGVELERSSAHWPPRVEGLDWIVLGRADDRAQRRDVLAALQALPVRPGCVVVLVSLLRTPDRGTVAYLRQLADTAGAPLQVLLDEGGLLQRRGGNVEPRAAVWRTLLAEIGVDAVDVLDLDRAEDRARLRNRLGKAA